MNQSKGPRAQRISCLTVRANRLLNCIKTAVSIAPAFIPPAKPPTPDQLKKFEAIWDTGATASAISQRVVDACGLKPIGMAQVNTANGVKNSPVFLVAMMLPSGVGFQSVQVTLADMAADDCLIGMDIISRGDFAITNRNGKTYFSFRTPSLEHIDFSARLVAAAQQQNAAAAGAQKVSPAGTPLASDSAQLPDSFTKNPFTKAIRFLKKSGPAKSKR